jgi:diaminopimelate epimerase
VSFPFVKGHGTRNDFIVLPDLDGSIHRDLDPSVVVALCDRRSGIGADGVLRVLATDGGVADGAGPGLSGQGRAGWFMDYRNADGSTSEMCGNGARVFARYLQRAGLVDTTRPLAVDTRAGVRTVTFCDDGEISVEMGQALVGSGVKVTVDGRVFDAQAVDVGNPHAVVLVDSLGEAGDLLDPPDFDPVDFPAGVNVEFVVVVGDEDLAMRVFERGVGETESCGTGACAIAAAVAAQHRSVGPTTYRVQVAGGTLSVTSDADGVVHLKGPAVLVAEGHWTA